MENIQAEMKSVKTLIGKMDHGDKKQVAVDSFKRLQEKVKGHGEALSKLKLAHR